MSEYRSGQGTIIPSFFIGLGGTGSKIVDRIMQRAMLLPNWDAELEDLTHFISIDTNEFDQHELLNIPKGNRINIAAFDKEAAVTNFRRSKNEQALQWLDEKYVPRTGVKPGAGQIRVESRLGFFYRSNVIAQRFTDLLNDAFKPGVTARQTSSNKCNVYIYCTLAGGTGSGSFLSAAYLINDLIVDRGWEPRLIGNFLLSTLVTDVVGPELHPKIHANTYAALKELEHMTKLGYPEIKKQRPEETFVFRLDNNDESPQVVRDAPFFHSFIIDKSPQLAIPNAVQAIADAAYMQVFTPVIGDMAGEYDNYEIMLQELTRFPGELKRVGLGYAKNYGAFGACAMVLPGEDLLRYCSYRFAAQAIRSQITFGVDPKNPGDDRARALARLAVDYSSPKFLNMSEEARESTINDSFVDSVLEMRRQDKEDEMEDGYWYKLVESVDDGIVTGIDQEKGEPIRDESLVNRVVRQLGEERQELLNKVSIKERAFTFHKDSVNSYPEIISRLKEDVRTSRVVIDEGIKTLETAAREGELVAALKMDPIGERFLVLRLLDKCLNEWLPGARAELAMALQRDISNPNISKRLDQEVFENLREAAKQGGIFNRDGAFYEARDEAQSEYRRASSSARMLFDADIKAKQYQALADFLRARSRQYMQLATKMDSLVADIESDAERMRRGEDNISPRFALSVEVFETLEEPRSRIWDAVYDSLFIEKGKYVTTFDRKMLAETISHELKPKVGEDGRVEMKKLAETVRDLRSSLLALGAKRMKAAIMGSSDEGGLDIAKGLTLEAKLMLRDRHDEVTQDMVADYAKKKVRAIEQMADVMARVNESSVASLDDGVDPNRTRLLISSIDDRSGGDQLLSLFVDQLSTKGRQVKTKPWHHRHIAIVHDVYMPVPLYYFKPIVDEVESAYEQVASDEMRQAKLHTASQWEESLPNLNPEKGEISVGWSLQMMAAGLLREVIIYDGDRFTWKSLRGDKLLGENLSKALYELTEIHESPERTHLFEKQIREAAVSKEVEQGRRHHLSEYIYGIIADIVEKGGTATDVEKLDEPVWKTLKDFINQDIEENEPAIGAPRRGLSFND